MFKNYARIRIVGVVELGVVINVEDKLGRGFNGSKKRVPSEIAPLPRTARFTLLAY